MNNNTFSVIVTLYILEFSPITPCDHYYIRSFLDAKAFISQMPPRPKQDFNELFGFKYDSETQAVTSGVSQQGKFITNKLISSVLFHNRHCFP